MSVSNEFARLRPAGGFKVILADPPWEWSSYSEKGQGKSPQQHYGCMSIDDICALPIQLLAADDCVVPIWVTWPLMMEWPRIINAWGLRYSGLLWEWRKFNPETGKYAFGPGYGTRKNLEPCLLCTRGNPTMRSELPDDLFGLGSTPEGVRSIRDWMEWWPDDEIRAPRREHSRKPDDQYDRIETMFDGPYVELFSRGNRAGWSAWGNEVGKFAEATS